VDLPPDFKELLEELVRDAVEFLLIGGYAVAFHGRPRATKDIDILLDGSRENLERAAKALATSRTAFQVGGPRTTEHEEGDHHRGRNGERRDCRKHVDGSWLLLQRRELEDDVARQLAEQEANVTMVQR